jgi:YesN/AraC family two-component response regulator
MARILVVDDDNHIRELMKESLEMRMEGVEIVTAKDGLEGLSIFRKDEKGGFDCVITDFQMPRLNGVLMIEAIRQLNPQQKIIIQSGDAGCLAGLFKTMRISNVPILSKGSYTMQQLVDLINA